MKTESELLILFSLVASIAALYECFQIKMLYIVGDTFYVDGNLASKYGVDYLRMSRWRVQIYSGWRIYSIYRDQLDCAKWRELNRCLYFIRLN